MFNFKFPQSTGGTHYFFMRQIFLLIFCCISFIGSAQSWKRTYETIYEAKWVIEDYDKGYLILGTNVITYRYGLIIKTDINGNVLWKKHFGNGSYNFAAMNVELTPDNGMIIGGTMTKYGNQSDAFILKLNACGELDWCTDVYTPTISDDLGWKVKPTVDNGYILLGELNDPNPNLRTNLFKFDSQGNLLWHQSYLPESGAFEDDGYDVMADSSGYLISDVVYYPDSGQAGGWERFYLIKTDTAGNKLWTNIYGKTTYYHGFPGTSLRSNTGNYYSFGTHDINNTNFSDPCMIKVLSNGSSSYNKDIVTNNYGGGICTANWLIDNQLILGGGWAVNTSYLADVIFKTDTLGNLLNSFIVDSTSSAICSTTRTFDNKFVSVATDCPNNCHIVAYKINSDLQWDSIYTHQYIYDSLCPQPIVSDTIDPNCQLVVNVEEPLTIPQSHQMKIFPNPTTGKLTVILPKYLLVNDNTPPVKSETIYHQWKSTILEAFDLNGNQVFQKEIAKDQPQLELDVSAWAKGIYFFKLTYNKNLVDGKKIIVE